MNTYYTRKNTHSVRYLFKDVKGNKCLPDELLYGRVGYIYSLLFMDQHMQKVHNSDIILQVTTFHFFFGFVIHCFFFISGIFSSKVCEEVLKRGKKQASMAFLGTPLMYEWYNTEYLGAAHGFMGILYILMVREERMKERWR